MPDTTVVLGSVQFTDLEIPAEIPFGGAQRLVVHELWVGGTRVVDAMREVLRTRISSGRVSSWAPPR